MRELTHEEKNLIRAIILILVLVVMLIIALRLSGVGSYEGANCTGDPPDYHMSPF